MCDQHNSEDTCPSNVCVWAGDRCRNRDTREEGHSSKYPALVWLTNVRNASNAQRGLRFCAWFLIILVAYIPFRLLWYQSTLRVRKLLEKKT